MKINLPKLPKKLEQEATMKIFYGMFKISETIAQQEDITTISDLSKFIDQMSPSDLAKYKIQKKEKIENETCTENREICKGE